MVSGMEWLLADQVICRILIEVIGPSVMCGKMKTSLFVSSSYLYVLNDCGKCISMKEDVISRISLPLLLNKLGHTYNFAYKGMCIGQAIEDLMGSQVEMSLQSWRQKVLYTIIAERKL